MKKIFHISRDVIIPMAILLLSIAIGFEGAAIAAWCCTKHLSEIIEQMGTIPPLWEAALMFVIDVAIFVLVAFICNTFLVVLFNLGGPSELFIAELETGYVMKWTLWHQTWEYVTKFDSTGRLMMLVDHGPERKKEWVCVAHDEG